MKHGYAGYTNGACRCEICCAAQAAYAHEYKQRPGVAERQRAYQAEYRERKRAEKHAYGVEYKRRRKEELLERERSAEGKRRRRERQNTRRARKLDQFVEDVDPEVVYVMHGGCCGICEEYVTIEDFHVDHVIPLRRGGPHSYANCQPAHPRCNLSKGAKLAS